MEIKGTMALVTGVNRGLDKAYAAAAAKAYVGARDPSSISDPWLVPVKLDVTPTHSVIAATGLRGDVNLGVFV
jgi:NAD(P)-dependent dehydrogenase (short-subunit alcohol dehydrogenase family)